ncbi:IclR family transcriptional regulator [Glycomyces niveus]|uniref:Helix-turn-helix domain-containing protein n=1 Tax=Glycomyces niveus TaxID=2820287 RepID=A0ABS3U1W1_9ACTN|nr:helix-turn-helix domain-containing protein [Glycomyces sp. NEAU-S30]MBO3732763.1 helix-turn-helix domain-containing protein [Glycomyces sp. NEAU-S30]
MDPEESGELLERSSLGSVGARSLRDRITRDEAEDVLRTAALTATAQTPPQDREPEIPSPPVEVRSGEDQRPAAASGARSISASPSGPDTAVWNARSQAEPTKMIQSVQRALRIMELVGRHPEGVTAARIAFDCGFSRATAYNLLRTLVYEEYLRRDENGRYKLGREVSARYSQLTRATTGPLTLAEYMDRFSVETGYSTLLGRFVEGRPAITDMVEGLRTPHVEEFAAGFDDGAHATALGKALLATLQPADRARFLRSAGMRAFTRRTLVEPDALEYDLAIYGESGVYAEMGQFKDGMAGAAVLVNAKASPDNAVAFGAMIPLKEIRTSWPRITQLLRDAARDLMSIPDLGRLSGRKSNSTN